MHKKIVLFLTLISLIVSSVVMYYLLFVPSSPHFLVLPHFMIDPVPVREQYEQLAQHTIDNIVLISPNHFDTCQGVFCTISQSHKVFR